MTETTRNAIDALQALRVPDLRTRYAELFGEETHCPNKTWLVRKITEALAAQDQAPAPTDPGDAQDAPPAVTQVIEEPDPAPTAPKLTKLSVEDLRAMYVDVVGRDTGSSNSSYLIWKIRQAEKGKVPVGPRATRVTAEPIEFKVLPLRLEADLVAKLDEARERLGLKSRMELFRRSLHAYLLEAGEVRVAEMFAAEA